MKLHATLRRTLALLLVLIFAMSNIGLAEVAEQLTQYEEVPVVFDDEYVETAAVEPEEEPEIAAEPEGEAEGQAPEEEVPVEEEAAAPELSAEAYLLDENSIFADASVANYEGALAYAWERAGEDGEWIAIEGATDATYVNADEDREAYAYRCVVSAGDVAAATNEVRFGTVAFVEDVANEPVDLGLSIEAAQLNAAPTKVDLSCSTMVDVVNKDEDHTTTATIVAGTAGSEAFTLTAAATGDVKESEAYTWAVDGGSANVLTIDSQSHERTQAFKWADGLDSQFGADGTVTATVTCKVLGKDDEVGLTQTLTLTVLKKITNSEESIKVAGDKTTFGLGDSLTIENPLSSLYGFKYELDTNATKYLTKNNDTSYAIKNTEDLQQELATQSAGVDCKITVSPDTKYTTLSGVQKALSFKIVAKPAGLKITVDETQDAFGGADDEGTVKLTVAATSGTLTAEQQAAIKWTMTGNTRTDQQLAFVTFNDGATEAKGVTATLKVAKEQAQWVTTPQDIVVTATLEGDPALTATHTVKFLPALTDEDLAAAGIQGLNADKTYIQPGSTETTINLSLGLDEAHKDYASAVKWSIAKKTGDGTGNGTVAIFNSSDSEFTGEGKLKIKTISDDSKLTDTSVYTITATVGEAKTTVDITVKPGADKFELHEYDASVSETNYKTAAIADKSDLLTYQGATLKLVPVFKLGGAAGNGTVEWTVTDILSNGVRRVNTDMKADDVGLNVTTSVAPMTYEITATPVNSTADPVTVTVKVLNKLPKLALKADRNYIFYGADKDNVTPLTVSVDMGIPEDEDAKNYYRDLEWNLELSTHFAAAEGDKTNVVGFTTSNSDNSIAADDAQIKKTGTLDAPVTSATIAAIDNTAEKVTDGYVTVKVTSASCNDTATLRIYVNAAPTVPSDVNGYVKLDKDSIAQGGKMTASLSEDAVKALEALEDATITDLPGTVVYEVEAAGNFAGQLSGLELADFIKQVEGQKGVFDVPALTLKDDSKSDYKNKITAAMQESDDTKGVKVTINAILPATKTKIGHADLLIYPNPDTVTVAEISDADTFDKAKDDIDTKSGSPATARVLYDQQVVLLKASAGMSEAAVTSYPDASLPDWTITAKDVHGNPTDASNVITELGRGESAKHARWLWFGVDGGEGSVEITIPVNADVDTTDEETPATSFVKLTYTVTSDKIEVAKTGDGKCATDSDHIWVFKPASTTNNQNGDNGYGHVYTCDTCGATSKPVAHRFITSADALVLKSEAQTLKCEICGFECKHTSGTTPTDTVTYTPVTKEGVYAHTYTCPVCGQLLQDAHVDASQDHECDLCHAQMATATLTYPTIQVGTTDPVLPTLTIENATTYRQSFAPASGAAGYITVDPDTGAITDAKALPKGTDTVKVEATITIVSEGKEIDPPLKVSADVKIVERIKAKDITIEGADWVTPDTGSSKEVVRYKYEANVGGNHPDLSDFEWVMETTTGDTLEDLVLKYLKDEQNPDDDDSYEEYTKASDKHITTVYVEIPKTAITAKDGSDDDKINFTLSYKGNDASAGDISTAATVQTKTIEFLPELTSSVLDEALNLSTSVAKNIAQGEVLSDVIDLDERYGEVTFEFAADPSNPMEPVQVPEWVVGTTVMVGNDEEPAISAKTASDTNVLKGSSDSKTFKVTPVVKGPLDPDAKADAVDSVKYPKMVKGTEGLEGKIKVVPKPAGIKIMMLNPDTAATEKWIEATAQTMTKNADTFTFKAVPVDADGKEITTNTIDLLEDSWNFTSYEADYGKDAYVAADAEVLSIEYADATSGAKAGDQNIDTGAYIVTLGSKATSPIKLTVTKSGTGSASVEIDVKSQITKMTVTPAYTEIAIDEEAPNPEDPDLTLPIKQTGIKIDAAITEPAKTADYDSSVALEWKAEQIVWSNGYDFSKASPSDVSRYLEGTGASRTLKLNDMTVTTAQVVRVTVTGKNVAEDVTGNYCDIILYPAVDDAEDLELTLDTEDSNDGSATGKEYSFLVGESIDIAEWGYASGYGASVKMAAPAVSKDAGEDNKPETEGQQVVAVESKTDKDGNVTYSVVAKNPGTAKVEIVSYNNFKTYLYFQVNPGADEVEFDATAAMTDTTRVIGEAAQESANKSFNVLESWIKAWTIGTTVLGKEEKKSFTGTKNYKLVAVKDDGTPDDGTVEIGERATNLHADVTKNGTGSLTGWNIKAKKAGSVRIYAMLGDVQSTNYIPVQVQEAAGEIYFVDGATGETLSAQKTLKVGDKFTLAAKMDIPTTIDGIKWNIPANNGYVEFGEVKDDSVEVTAKAAGSVTVSVSIPDKNAPEGATDEDPVHPASKMAFIEILVFADETSTPTISAEVDLAGKKAIGVGETTNAVVLGLKLAAGQSVTWISDKPGIAEVNASTGVVTGRAAGDAKISAMVDDQEIGSTTVYVLTPITTWNVADVKITKGESIEIAPTFGDGYRFADGVTAAANLIDERGLFSIDYKNEAKESKYATLTPTDEGKYVVTGLAKGTVTLVMTPFDHSQSKEIKVTVTSGALKSFAVSVANSTLYLAPSGSQAIGVTFNPTSAPANLTWTVDRNGVVTDDITVTKTNDTTYTVAAAESATKDVEYTVTASADGVQGIAPQSFTVVVADNASEAASAKIVLKKVGTEKTFDVADGATVEVVKGEKLQAMLYDDTDPLGGVAWSTTAKSSKATVSGNVITAKSGKAEITATAGSKTYKFTVSAKSAPSVKLDPNVTSITVGVGETFTMGLTSKYSYNGEWYTVTGGEDILENVPDEQLNKTTIWKATDVGTATVTLAPTWGKSAKKVQVTVLPEVDLSIDPTTQILTKGDKLRMTANMASGYANLTWTVEGETVTSKATKLDGTKLTVKQVANDAIEFTSTTKTTLSTLKVKVEAKGYVDEDVSAEATVNVVDRAELSIPAGTKVEFDKDVIGVKETTQAYVNTADDQNMANSLTWSTGNKKIATVSAAGVVTGKKAGMTTITAKSKADNSVVAEGTIYVLSEAKVQANIWPKTMAQGETATIELTITGYEDTAKVLPADGSVEIATGNLLTATSSSDLITVEQPKAKEGQDEPAYVYELKLKAQDEVSKVNNKYPKATVAVNLSWKKNVKKGSIQVVEQPNVIGDEANEDLEVYFPAEINIAKGKNIALTPSFGDVKNVAANFDWVLSEDETDAAKQAASAALLNGKLLYVKDGKLYADRKATAGTAILTGTATIGEMEKTVEALVTVCDAVKSNKDFDIVAPKMKAGLGEKVQMEVKYLNDRKAGSVTWSSSNSKVATIDKTTGLLTAKKKGTVTITLKVNGKAEKLKNFKVMNSMPTGIHFAQAEQNIAPGNSGTFSVVLEGVDFEPAKAGTKELAYTIEVREGETYLDPEGTDLDAGKLKIKSGIEPNGKVVLRATSYNGLVAECVISLSETSISDTPYSKPAKIVIRANNTELKDGDTVTMKESDSINLTAIVKDSNDVEVKNATVTWSSDEHYTIESAAGAKTAKLTAVKYTDEDAQDALQVTVKAGQATANFVLKIEPQFNKQHIKFVPDGNKYTLVNGQKVTAKFDVDVLDLQVEFRGWTPKFNIDISGTGASTQGYYGSSEEDKAAQAADKVADYIDVSADDKTGVAKTYTIKAKKAGTAVIKIRLEKGDDKIELDPVTIQIIELPEGDNADDALAQPDTMTLAAGETKSFTAKLAGDYAGKEASDTFQQANITLIEKEDPETGLFAKDTSSGLTVTYAKDPKVFGKYDVKGKQEGKYQVTIGAFTKEDDTYASNRKFIVNVTAAPEFKITVPEPLKAVETPANTVTINATQADKSIILTADINGTTNDVTWEITSSTSGADAPTLTPADGKGKTVTLSNPKPDTNKPVMVEAKLDGFDPDTTTKKITINYAAAPADGALGLNAGDAVITAGDGRTMNGEIGKVANAGAVTNVAKIAVGEQVTATLDFKTPATTYANDITWSVQSTTQQKLKLDYAEDCRTCKITGVNPTGTGSDENLSTILVEAKSGDVVLATFGFKVAASTKTLDLVYANGNAFDRKLTTGTNTLKAKLDENTDALVKIRVTDSTGKDITSTVVGSPIATKNNWTISSLSAGKVTITIWVQEGDSARLSQSYIATVGT